MHEMKKFLFFAYREWAINIFRKIAEAGNECLLVTQKNNCTKEFIDKINPDIIFFYGWSWIVPQEIVDAYPCLCLHPSPLPKYRGGSPIQNQIIAGETRSAVTIFKMNNKLDGGTILYQHEFSLEGTLNEIFNRINVLGTIGTQIILDKYNWDYIEGVEQDESLVTFCQRRKPEESEIKPTDFIEHDAKYFYNIIRALQPPYPEPFIQCREGKLIIEKVRYEL
jgi:methionyl-tRNA formyltransferase